MGDYFRITPDGEVAIDLSRLTREQWAALAEVTADDYVNGRGEDARTVCRVRIRLHDKLGAIVKLGQHLGGFGTNRTVTGPGGGPVQTMAATLELGQLDADGRKALRAYRERRGGRPRILGETI
jgi:phage terminase small subunit